MKKLGVLALIGLTALTLLSCNQRDYEISVVCPTGAPAISVASHAINNKVSYTFIDASTISEQFTANKDDVIIAPVNAGAKLYKNNKSTYKLAAVLTWGNIYFATQRTDITSIDDLAGKSVTLFGETTINASIAKYVLEQKNITVNYETALSTAADTQGLLISDSNSIVVTAEPALTAAETQLAKNDKAVTSFSISELYSEVSGGLEYTQAGLFVSNNTIDKHLGELEEYLEEIENSCTLVTTNAEEVANNIIELGNTGLPAAKAVILKALPKCNIKYVSAKDAKSSVEATASVDLKQFGGALPQNDFYYGL